MSECSPLIRLVIDAWQNDVWNFQAKSGAQGFRPLLLHFPSKIALQEKSGNTPGSPRYFFTRRRRQAYTSYLSLHTACRRTHELSLHAALGLTPAMRGSLMCSHTRKPLPTNMHKRNKKRKKRVRRGKGESPHKEEGEDRYTSAAVAVGTQTVGAFDVAHHTFSHKRHFICGRIEDTFHFSILMSAQ